MSTSGSIRSAERSDDVCLGAEASIELSLDDRGIASAELGCASAGLGCASAELLLEAAQRAGWTEGEMAEAVKKVASSTALEVQHKYSRPKFADAETLPAVILINHGRFDDLTTTDVQTLFDCLDKDNSGSLDFEEIKALLMEVLKPACTLDQVELIYQLTDKKSDGQVTVQELFKALTAGPVKEHLRNLQTENAALQQLQDFIGVVKVDHKFFLERLRGAVTRDDAFKALPFSVAFILIFVCLVILHLQIFERQRVEHGLFEWIAGSSGGPTGPYLDSVSDIDGIWGWLSGTGLAAVFGDCAADLSLGGNSSCFVGTRGILIGNARLDQMLRDGSERSVWLLSTDRAHAVLENKPGAYLDAALATIGDLQASSWVADDAMTVNLVFNTFSQDSQMFAVTDVQVRLDDFGYVAPTVSVSAVMVDPYPLPLGQQVLYYAIDSLFLLCLLYPLYSEVKDILVSAHLSGCWDTCTSYWGFWNIVDWASICFGFTGAAVWVLSCQAMNDQRIHRLMHRTGDGELLLDLDVMHLDDNALIDLDNALERVISLFFVLRLMVAGNAILIVFKFFKGAQANPRMRIVTETLIKASSDIFHWAIVFLAVFLGFAVTGHILFGIDLVQFRSMYASIDSCFRTLMGEFDWYGDMTTSLQALRSGMPTFLVQAWYYVFMVFVLLILVNMLLAIVLEHYAELETKLKTDIDAFPIWEQAYGLIRERRQNKGFIPRANLLYVLEDDDSDIHRYTSESSEVSEQAFMKMFPNMKEEQASSLAGWIEHQYRAKAQENVTEMDTRMKKLEGLVDRIAQHLHTIKLNVAMCTSKMNQVKKDQGSKNHSRASSKTNSRPYPSEGPACRDFKTMFGEAGEVDDSTGVPPSRDSRSPRVVSRENSQVQRENSPQIHGRANRRLASNASVVTVLTAHGTRHSAYGENEEAELRAKFRSEAGEPEKPARQVFSVCDQVAHMSLKLGSSVQDLRWKLNGAVDSLVKQADKYMDLAHNRVNEAPAVHSLLLGKPSPSPVLRKDKQADGKEIPQCWLATWRPRP